MQLALAGVDTRSNVQHVSTHWLQTFKLKVLHRATDASEAAVKLKCCLQEALAPKAEPGAIPRSSEKRSGMASLRRIAARMHLAAIGACGIRSFEAMASKGYQMSVKAHGEPTFHQRCAVAQALRADVRHMSLALYVHTAVLIGTSLKMQIGGTDWRLRLCFPA